MWYRWNSSWMKQNQWIVNYLCIDRWIVLQGSLNEPKTLYCSKFCCVVYRNFSRRYDGKPKNWSCLLSVFFIEALWISNEILILKLWKVVAGEVQLIISDVCRIKIACMTGRTVYLWNWTIEERFSDQLPLPLQMFSLSNLDKALRWQPFKKSVS